MADFNPLNELPDPKSFTGNNMGGTFMLPGFFDATLKREQAAAPFIQMAQEAERMRNDQTRQMNPLLLQEKGLQNTGLANTNDRFSRATPFEIDKLRLGNLKSEQDINSGALDLAVKGVETPEKIRGIQEKPLANAIDMFSSSADQIKKLPPPLQVGAYMKAAQGVAAAISDPAMRQRFIQEFMSDPTAGFQRLQAQAAQKYNTPEYRKAMDVGDAKNATDIKQAQIQAEATIEAARIRERSAEKLQQLAAEQPKNAAVMVLNARKWLASPPANATPEQMAEKQGIVEGDDQNRARELLKDYQSSMIGVQDAAQGKAKTYADFLQMVKNNFKQVGGPRPGPTPEAARNLNVGDADLLNKYAPR